MFPKQRGISLMLALFVLLVGSLIVIAMLSLRSSGSTALVYEVLGQRSYWLAKSQLELGLVRLFPLGGGAGQCDSSTINWDTVAWSEDWRGCQSQLQCTTVTVDQQAYYRLQSSASCSAGDITTSRVLVAEASL